MDSDIWAAIERAGPMATREMFDPLVVDDVIAAERASAQYDRRRAFVASYAWAVPTREAIACIRNAVGERRMLEVCAGSGLWARLLSDAGVSVRASDAGLDGTGHSYPVEPLEAEQAVKLHRECGALMLCWPPFKDDCALRALSAFEGDIVVFVGDARFTAERRFHERLATHWRLLREEALPSWPGTVDAARIYASTLTGKRTAGTFSPKH